MLKSYSSLKLILLAVLAFGTVSVFSSYAVAAPNEVSCSKKDLQKIKKFDKKVEKRIEELKESMERLKSGRVDEDDVKDHEEILEFFESEKYQNMMVIYERCDREDPFELAKKPFWMPL